jgi:hypothetical protein
MALTDLKLTPAEAKDMVADCSPCGEGDPPKYPYGSSLYMTDEILKKLGITELPPVGTKMLLTAEVFVTGVSEREDQKEKHKSVDLQMSAATLVPKAEPKPDRSEGRAERMFPTMLTS